MGKSEGYRVSCEERRKKADSINLIVYATETNARYPRTTLACDKARSYRAPKNANDILAKVYENTEDLPRIDKPSIRQDRKGGKSNPRRTYTEKRCTYTEKPPPDECCTFRICLSLDPGKCWFLPPWAGCRRHKFHTKFPPVRNDVGWTLAPTRNEMMSFLSVKKKKTKLFGIKIKA
jgi:hypothetical protein